MFNVVAPYRYLFPNMYLFMADISNQGFCVWLTDLELSLFYKEPCLHPVGPHDRLSQKNVNRATIAGTRGFDTISLSSSSSSLSKFLYKIVIVVYQIYKS